MNAKEFVGSVSQLAPNRSDYEKIGLDSSEIEEKLEEFDIKLKKQSASFSNKLALLDLVTNYNLEKLVIGQVLFLDKIIETDDYFQIGMMEVDPIVINKISFQVEVLEYVIEGPRIFLCASSGENFMKSLLVCIDHFNKCLLNDEYFNDDENACRLAHVASDIAGGIQYLDFYKNLLGCFR